MGMCCEKKRIGVKKCMEYEVKGSRKNAMDCSKWRKLIKDN